MVVLATAVGAVATRAETISAAAVIARVALRRNERCLIDPPLTRVGPLLTTTHQAGILFR
jgi:hypothetical protein